jgi:hypothetical protein
MKEIQLTQGRVALVDNEDYDFVMSFGKWGIEKRKNTMYATRKILIDGRMKRVYMHSIIMQANGAQVDHKFGDGLDNRKANLRICTHAQNQMNRGVPSNNKSGFKGVCWHKNMKRWVAYIKVNNKNVVKFNLKRQFNQNFQYNRVH